MEKRTELTKNQLSAVINRDSYTGPEKDRMEGLFSKEWRKYQQQHFEQLSSRKGASIWTTKVIR